MIIAAYISQGVITVIRTHERGACMAAQSLKDKKPHVCQTIGDGAAFAPDVLRLCSSLWRKWQKEGESIYFETGFFGLADDAYLRIGDWCLVREEGRRQEFQWRKGLDNGDDL